MTSADDLTLPVKVTGTRESVRDFDKLADAIADTGKRAALAGRQLAEAAGAIDGAGDQAAQAARKVQHLGRELDKLHSKKIRLKVDVDESHFARLHARISSLFSGLPGAFGAVPTPVKYGALAAGASAVLGPAGGAATLLAGGALGLVPGLIGASKDPAVVAAFKRLGETFQKALVTAGGPLVQPLQNVADRWETTLKTVLAPMFLRLSTALAPNLERLGAGLAGMVEEIGPGLERLAISAKPVLDKLAEHLPKLGESVTKFFDEIGKHAPAIALWLDKTLGFVEALIPVVGRLIGFFAELWVKIDNAIHRLEGLLDILGLLPSFKESSKTDTGFGRGGTMVGQGFGVKHRAAGGPVYPGESYDVGEHAVERLTMFPGGGGYVTPAMPRGNAGDFIGTVEVRLVGLMGEHIRTEMVTLRRRKGYTTFDRMFPA